MSMTNEQILEKQVEALEKLLQLKQAIIDEQEKQIGKLEMDRIYHQPHWQVPQPHYQPFVGGGGAGGVGTYTPDLCPIGPMSNHEYPSMWGGTNPPCCTKCGKQQASIPSWTITGAQGSVAIGSGGGASSGVVTINNNQGGNVTDINHPNNKLTTLTTAVKR